MSAYQIIFKKLLENSELHFNSKGLFYNVMFKRMDGKIVTMTIMGHNEAYWDCEAEMLKREIKIKEDRNNG